VAGRVCDTGRGYPALLPGPTHHAPGWLVTLRDAPVVLQRLDHYEGTAYRRCRVAATTVDGTPTACWTYVWAADTVGLTPVEGAWTA
jgi:gamma-glutamylcyclotransferase (GGCT)/AIG2-like uncharacterized protein YtfP